MACISRFATAILRFEIDLALGTIRVKYTLYMVFSNMVKYRCAVCVKVDCEKMLSFIISES